MVDCIVPRLGNRVHCEIGLSSMLCSYEEIISKSLSFSSFFKSCCCKNVLFRMVLICNTLDDLPLAPPYGRVLNYARKKCKLEELQNRALSYAVDTGTLFGIYAPAYTGVLALSGASIWQIGCALMGMRATIAVTARPFGKYALNNWRNYCGY